MAHQLLQSKREQAQELVDALQYALKQVQHCRMCNTFCEGSLCDICSDESRDKRRLMIVHMPADVSNMETANCHDGLYFVLMGQINPAQGMDVSAIALDKLVSAEIGAVVLVGVDVEGGHHDDRRRDPPRVDGPLKGLGGPQRVDDQIRQPPEAVKGLDDAIGPSVVGTVTAGRNDVDN